MFSPEVKGSLAEIRRQFQSGKPFRHACIENFLLPEVAEHLLTEFPVFDSQNAINEFGQVGGKAVKTDLRSIGPAYTELYEFLRSKTFLDAASEMLGIPGLLFDDAMYGGGTHENLEGQELDPHVDFNYDQAHGWHRRVNLLIYLNKEWDKSWGGAIQLHSDPWDWDHDDVKTFNCDFNRCVVFETNEYSWHGFRRIKLPPSKVGMTRKCISIYLYTKERPAEEIAPRHGTFYAQRPLPPRLQVGTELTQDDVRELKELLKKRDGWIRKYQQQELAHSGESENLGRYINSLLAATKLPLLGYVRQVQNSAWGVYHDGWLAPDAGAKLHVEKPVQSIRLRVWIPESMHDGQQINIMIDGNQIGTMQLQPGQETSVNLGVLLTESRVFELAFRSLRQVDGGSGDARALACVLASVEFQHA